jgi:hypothetical protein
MRWNFDSPLDRSEYSVLQRQLLAHGRWFSPGTPASSTTKTGRHDIAEILLKVALSTNNQSINQRQLSSNCFLIVAVEQCSLRAIRVALSIHMTFVFVFCFAYFISLVQPWTSCVGCCCTGK